MSSQIPSEDGHDNSQHLLKLEGLHLFEATPWQNKKVFMTKQKFMLKSFGYHHIYKRSNIIIRISLSKDLSEFGKGEANHPRAR